MKDNYFCFKKNHLFIIFFVFVILVVFSISAQINNHPKITQSKAIYGGSYVSSGEFPYFVALTWNRPSYPFYNNFFCGGALLNSSWVITASHCVNAFIREAQAIQDEERKVAISLSPSISLTPKPKISYKNIKIYANFIDMNFAYLSLQSEVIEKESFGLSDIVLLKLKYPISVSKYPQLPTDDKYYQKEQLFTFMGFGEYSKKNFFDTVNTQTNKIPAIFSTKLKKATHNIKSVGALSFKSNYPYSSFCKGDSGGPAVVKETDKDVIIGIVSSNVGCEENIDNHFAKVKYMFSVNEIKKKIEPTPTKIK